MIDLLNLEEIENIREDVKSVLEDHNFDTRIVYRRVTGRSFNPSTGVTTRTVEDTEIKTFMANHSAREVGNSGGILQVGDVFFMFDPSLLDEFPLPDDQIMGLVSKTGNVKLTLNSKIVTGYNTQFRIDGVQGGDLLKVDDQEIFIESVSDDALVLKTVWPVATEAAAEFKIYRLYEIVQRIIDPLRAAVRLSARRAGA